MSCLCTLNEREERSGKATRTGPEDNVRVSEENLGAGLEKRFVGVVDNLGSFI